MKVDHRSLRVLGISGSPRKGANTAILVQTALDGAKEAVPGATTVMLELAGKTIKPCIDCGRCREAGKCIIKDDYAAIAEEYWLADALLLGSPVYHMGITGQMKCLLDRLGNAGLNKFNMKVPRHMKVGGVIAQGMNRFGGQEFTEAMLINSLLLMNCLAISGDIPLSYIGAAGSTYGNGAKDAIGANEIAMNTARNLGRRVAEAAMIIRAGVDCLTEVLPVEYRQGRAVADGCCSADKSLQRP